MFFELWITFARVTAWYGDMPERPEENRGDYEEFELDWPSDQDLLLEDFADPMWDLCHVALDMGDVDWFNAEKCVLLKEWLENRLQQPCNDRLEVLYGVLLDYANRAIEYGTGVVVEL